MNLPKIAPDDAVLFGSIAAFASGIGIVVGALTDPLLGFGMALFSFGLPSAVVAFLAAGESK